MVFGTEINHLPDRYDEVLHVTEQYVTVCGGSAANSTVAGFACAF